MFCIPNLLHSPLFLISPASKPKQLLPPKTCAAVFSLSLGLFFSFLSRNSHLIFRFQLSIKYQLVQVPGKGQGLVATQDLKAGEVFVAESPIIRVSQREAGMGRARGPEYVKALFDALPSEPRNEALKLHTGKGLKPGDKGLEDDIFGAYTFHCGDNDSGLFLELSKINHSCNPNSSHCWIEELQKKKGFTLRDIKKGEELTICYSSINLSPRKERQEYLVRGYCFTCTWETCSLKGVEQKQSDKARKIVGYIVRDRLFISADPKKAIEMVKIAEKLFEQENSLLERSQRVSMKKIDGTWKGKLSICTACSDYKNAKI